MLCTVVLCFKVGMVTKMVILVIFNKSPLKEGTKTTTLQFQIASFGKANLFCRCSYLDIFRIDIGDIFYALLVYWKVKLVSTEDGRTCLVLQL